MSFKEFREGNLQNYAKRSEYAFRKEFIIGGKDGKGIANSSWHGRW
jgi:hypothetical protein